MKRSPFPAMKWVAGVLGGVLLTLGGQSAWNHVAHSISPPPPPLADQINALVHDAATHGLILSYQSIGRFHPGGDLSYVFAFDPSSSSGSSTPSSELRIYDTRHGRLRLAYQFRPTTGDGGARPSRSFGIRVLDGSVPAGAGAYELVAALEQRGTTVTPTIPVIIRWRPNTDTYVLTPVIAGSRIPRLQGALTFGYARPLTIKNSVDSTEQFSSGYAEAVQLDRAPKPVLLALFIAAGLPGGEWSVRIQVSDKRMVALLGPGEQALPR